MAELILKARRVSKGRAEGEAIVLKEAFSFLGSVDRTTGVICDKEHELAGQSIAGKILVFPYGHGSTVGAYEMLDMVRYGTQPRGILNLRSDPVIAVGAIISDIPMMDRPDGNPLELIRTGDRVVLDADAEVVTIYR